MDVTETGDNHSTYMRLFPDLCEWYRTWVTRNDEMVAQLKNLLNETLPRPRTWRWLSSSPAPFYIKPVKTLGTRFPPPLAYLSRATYFSTQAGVEVTI